MKKITLTFYSDPGHAWLKAPRKLLHDLGIADKITGYSYQKNDYVYLEEDCDAGTLLDALEAKNITVTIKEKVNRYKDSIIRTYDPYICSDIELLKSFLHDHITVHYIH